MATGINPGNSDPETHTRRSEVVIEGNGKYMRGTLTVQQALCCWYHLPITVPRAAEIGGVPEGFMRTLAKITYDDHGRAADEPPAKEIREYENPYR